MKGILVISFDWPTPDDIPKSLEAIDPPKLPHFDGDVRVAIDGFNDENVATKVIKYLEDDDASL